ncbi:hypothetical protein CDAR_220431 [Caerostris darwini]|uniref:Uncharacterized protein n=1 Tax=Caerostris darwini TaxID=1538125 RepID=A0AAV4UFH6_9ARAC|nr:hypothetical protein CDAR_220431 [Caerostris darwini]
MAHFRLMTARPSLLNHPATSTGKMFPFIYADPSASFVGSIMYLLDPSNLICIGSCGRSTVCTNRGGLSLEFVPQDEIASAACLPASGGDGSHLPNDCAAAITQPPGYINGEDVPFIYADPSASFVGSIMYLLDPSNLICLGSCGRSTVCTNSRRLSLEFVPQDEIASPALPASG